MNNLSNAESELFRRIAEGDEKAFRTIFQLYLPKFYPFVIKLTRSEQAAQDLIQDAFIRVWINRDKVSDIQNPGGWLYRVVANECYRYLRNKAKRNGLHEPLQDVADVDTTPHSRLALDELKLIIAEAVSKLPPQRKLIYQMSRIDGKSIPEIAGALDLSPNTVKNTLVASLKFIRGYLIKREIIVVGIIFLFI